MPRHYKTSGGNVNFNNLSSCLAKNIFFLSLLGDLEALYPRLSTKMADLTGFGQLCKVGPQTLDRDPSQGNS